MTEEFPQIDGNSGNLREKLVIQADASQSLRLLALSAQYPLPSRMAARTSCNAEILVAYRVLQRDLYAGSCCPQIVQARDPDGIQVNINRQPRRFIGVKNNEVRFRRAGRKCF